MTQIGHLSAARAQLADRLLDRLGADPSAAQVLARFDQWGPDLFSGLAAIYPEELVDTLARVVDLIVTTTQQRSRHLRERDLNRPSDWFQSHEAIGYVAYTDLFAGDLQGVRTHIDYLRDLGVTYLHLMPLLQPRPEPNDGGYAVMDYRNVRPDLGSMADLAELATNLHESNIALTLDLVLNHVAEEHEWAVKARAGDPKFRNYFYIYPDRTMPDRFEATLPEVFPAFAPGNFTWNDDVHGWVWTTFNTWQWDVNWSNPDVFCEFVDIIGFLANQGVDCLRLDAIAFTWKREGTNCQNQPEVHQLTQALRAFTRIAAPSTIFKAEAIVGPNEVRAYLGEGEHAGKVSDMAYHNSLMVQIWSALAARDARLLVHALNAFAATPSTTAWATYLRCHDDIGWAIDDADAAAMGWSGFGHRNFLADFYSGDFDGSFAKGAHFQSNPLTGDKRTSGTAASLAGIEAALDHNNEQALTTAIDRLLCSYAIVFGFGGLPLLYMGDEWALLNDHTYLDDPSKAADNRWMHRPPMDWSLTQSSAGDPLTHDNVARRVNKGVRALIAARTSLPGLHASVSSEIMGTEEPAVFMLVRRHPSGPIVEVYNLSEDPRNIRTDTIVNTLGTSVREVITQRTLTVGEGIQVPPYAAWWLVSA